MGSGLRAWWLGGLGAWGLGSVCGGLGGLRGLGGLGGLGVARLADLPAPAVRVANAHSFFLRVAALIEEVSTKWVAEDFSAK